MDNNQEINFWGKHRYAVSIMFAFIICFMWFVIIDSSANRSGGDNGSDPFGIMHAFIFYVLLIPIFYVSSKLFYKLLKPTLGITDEQEKILKLTERSDWFLLLLIPLILAFGYLISLIR